MRDNEYFKIKKDYIYIVILIGMALIMAELVFLLAGSVIGLACDILNYNGVWVLIASIICAILICIAILQSFSSEQ